jgi:hypothetical protein
MEERWLKLVGEEPCDLLKLDIEGSELDFIRNETAFLQRTKTIFIEWHKWRGVTLDEVKNLLGRQGFLLKRVLQEEEAAGTAVFIKGKA